MRDIFKNGASIFLKRQTDILSAATIIMVTYGASALVGLLRDRLLAATFFGGREWQLDAYFAAFLIPDTIFQLLVFGALSAAFIPIFASLLTNRQKEDAWYVASASTTLVMTGLIAVAAAVFVFAEPISHLIAPGFSPEKLVLMTSLVRIMIVAQVFFGLSAFLSGILQVHQRFLVPAIAPILYNVGIVIGIVFLSPIFGIYGPAIGVIIGSIFHLGIQIFPAARLGFSLKPIWDPGHPAVAEIARLMIPRTIALSIDQIEQFVAVFLATMLSAGSLSLFNFARHIYLLPAALFGVTIGQASLPVLSGQAASNFEVFKKTLSSSLLQILYLTLPAGIGILVLRIPLVRIVFGAKAFPWPATILTGQIVAFLALSIASQAVIQLLVRGFYAIKDTKTPLAVGFVSACINLVLSFYLTFQQGMGVNGIALAISISALFESFALFVILEKRIKNLIGHEFWLAFGKMLIITSILGVILWVLMRSLDQIVFDTTRTSSLVALTLTVSLVGLVIYIFLSWLAGIEQLFALTNLFGKIGKWREILSQSEEVLEASDTPANPE